MKKAAPEGAAKVGLFGLKPEAYERAPRST